VLPVLGAVAELERSLIAERVKCGIRNKIAKTGRWGRRRLHFPLDFTFLLFLKSMAFRGQLVRSRYGILNPTNPPLSGSKCAVNLNVQPCFSSHATRSSIAAFVSSGVLCGSESTS
jgi:hypothetical protein